MEHRIDKFLNPYTLIIFNFLIIVGAESVGGGHYFFESGLIHIIALVFIALAFSKLLSRTMLGDPMLKKFVVAAMLSMLVFASSHIIEFIGFVLFHAYEDSVFASVINLYAISLLLIVIGTDSFLSVLSPKKTRVKAFAYAGIAVLIALTIANFLDDKLISLEPDEPAPWLYSIAIIAIALVAMRGISSIQKRLPRFSAYTKDLAFAVVLILIALIPNVFYEGFEENLGIEKFQIIYLHHFGFYAALSVMYLAFDRLQHLGGVLKDLREEGASGNRETQPPAA